MPPAAIAVMPTANAVSPRPTFSKFMPSTCPNPTKPSESFLSPAPINHAAPAIAAPIITMAPPK